MNAPVGYSGKPLAAKLGYGGQGAVWSHAMPDSVRAEIEEPGRIDWTDQPGTGAADAHLFVRQRAELDKLLAKARAELPDDATIWISWPKKSAKVETDLTEDRIRDAALPLGLVDVKVCAVDAIWSGLKLVLRKELRGKDRNHASK